MRIKVTAVATGLGYPFGIAFLPDNVMLVTTREGEIRVIRNGVLDPQPMAGLPKGYFTGTSGLPGAVHGYMDVVLHPQFAQNKYVYLSYTKLPAERRSAFAIARGTWDGKTIVGMKDIFVSDEGAGGVARLAFDRTSHLYVTTAGAAAQDVNSQQGKVLRLMDDGSVPKDNPFVGRADAKPQVFTMGHRNSLGLAMNPATGEMWQNENGPNGGDEINVLVAGKNYGWPLVGYGRNYDGVPIPSPDTRPDLAKPVIYWDPVIAPGNLMFYRGSVFPQWNGSALISGLASRAVVRVTFDGKGGATAVQRWDVGKRVRDIEEAPDGSLWMLEDANPGGLFHLTPKSLDSSAR
jgi:glucose/arabinose dehydrogenase